MTGATTPPVSPREIADLLGWAHTLTHAGPAADPAEQAAYLAAKADLLARITDPHPDTEPAAEPATAEPAIRREGR